MPEKTLSHSSIMYTANSALDEQKIFFKLLLYFCSYSLDEDSVRVQTPASEIPEVAGDQ